MTSETFIPSLIMCWYAITASISSGTVEVASSIVMSRPALPSSITLTHFSN